MFFKFKSLAVALLVCGKAKADEYQSNAATCVDCYSTGGSNCITSDFSYSYCCNYQDEASVKTCASSYAFCTYNIVESYYKIFTCPQYNCPDANQAQVITHQYKNQAQTTLI